MKKYLLFLPALLFSLTLSAQTAPAWQWAKTIGWNVTDNNGRGDAANDVTTDAAGNVYVTGNFLGSVDFGDGNLITSYGNSDMFLASYDCSGQLRWAVHGGGGNSDHSRAVAVADDGSVYVGGHVGMSNAFPWGQDSIRFGDTSYLGISDMFLVKYDSSGNFQWLRNSGTITPGSGQLIVDLHIASDGNIRVLGYGGRIGFPGHAYNSRGFVSTYDTEGNLLNIFGVFDYVNSQTLLRYTVPTSLAVDSIGNAYVGGYFTDSLIVGGVQLVHGGVPLGNNAFVCKFDPVGNTSWVRQGHSFQNTHVRASNLALSKSEDRLYITGDYSGDIAYGSDTLIATSIYSTIYLFEMDTSGNTIRAKSGYSQAAVNQSGSITLKDDKIAISGIVYSSLTWGGHTISSVLGQNDPFIALMDTALNVDTMYVIPVFGNSPAPLNGLAYDQNDNLYISGIATGNVYLPTDTAYFKGGNTDALLAKFGTDCSSITSISEELLSSSENLQLQAWPNPTDGRITIAHDLRQSSGTLVLHDMQGRKLLEQEIRSNTMQTELDLSGRAAGLYLISLVTEQGRSSFKVMLKAE